MLSRLDMCQVMRLANDMPLPRIFDVLDIAAFDDLIRDSIGIPDVAVVIPNGHASTASYCPFFLVLLTRPSNRDVTNYLLRRFLTMVQAPASVNARSDVAFVIGMESQTGHKMVSVPLDFHAMGQPMVASQFQLSASCERCHVKHRRCGGIMPCGRCQDIGAECVPQESEEYSRGRLLYTALKSGGLQHNDYALFQLHLQAVKMDMTQVMTRAAVFDMMPRIRLETPLSVPPKVVTELPSPLLGMVVESTMCKVEWMYDGEYTVQMSESYRETVISEEGVWALLARWKTLPKLVDTLMLDDPRAAYNLWCDTLTFMGLVCSYRGSMWSAKAKKVVACEIRMQSIVLTHNHIITVTAVHLQPQ